MIDIEQLGEFLNILRGCLCLTVEQSSAGYFIATEFLGYSFERQTLLRFRSEQRRC